MAIMTLMAPHADTNAAIWHILRSQQTEPEPEMMRAPVRGHPGFYPATPRCEEGVEPRGMLERSGRRELECLEKARE